MGNELQHPSKKRVSASLCIWIVAWANWIGAVLTKKAGKVLVAVYCIVPMRMLPIGKKPSTQT